MAKEISRAERVRRNLQRLASKTGMKPEQVARIQVMAQQKQIREQARLDQMNRINNAMQGLIGNFAVDDDMALEVMVQGTCGIAVAMKYDASKLATAMAKAFANHKHQADVRNKAENAKKAAENAQAILEGKKPPHDLGEHQELEEPTNPDLELADKLMREAEQLTDQEEGDAGDEPPPVTELYANREGCPKCSTPGQRVIHANQAACPNGVDASSVLGPDGRPVS